MIDIWRRVSKRRWASPGVRPDNSIGRLCINVVRSLAVSLWGLACALSSHSRTVLSVMGDFAIAVFEPEVVELFRYRFPGILAISSLLDEHVRCE